MLVAFKYTSQPAGDQARPRRHQRQPADAEAVQGQYVGRPPGAGAPSPGRGPAVRARPRADGGHDRAGDVAPGTAVPVVRKAAAAGRRGGGRDDATQRRGRRPLSRGKSPILGRRGALRPGQSACEPTAAARFGGTSGQAGPAIIAWCFRWATAGGQGTGGRRRLHARQLAAARLVLLRRLVASVRAAVRPRFRWSSRLRSSIPGAIR